MDSAVACLRWQLLPTVALLPQVLARERRERRDLEAEKRDLEAELEDVRSTARSGIKAGPAPTPAPAPADSARPAAGVTPPSGLTTLARARAADRPLARVPLSAIGGRETIGGLETVEEPPPAVGACDQEAPARLSSPGSREVAASWPCVGVPHAICLPDDDRPEPLPSLPKGRSPAKETQAHEHRLRLVHQQIRERAARRQARAALPMGVPADESRYSSPPPRSKAPRRLNEAYAALSSSAASDTGLSELSESVSEGIFSEGVSSEATESRGLLRTAARRKEDGARSVIARAKRPQETTLEALKKRKAEAREQLAAWERRKSAEHGVKPSTAQRRADPEWLLLRRQLKHASQRLDELEVHNRISSRISLANQPRKSPQESASRITPPPIKHWRAKSRFTAARRT